MQEDVKKRIQDAALFASITPPYPVPSGEDRYTGKQHEYFESPTRGYVWEIAKYTSNYFKAHVQGIIPGTFETERGAYIRSSDVVEQTTGNKLPNDYQTIYFQDMRIKGMYTGGKVKYGGNTWLAIGPFNIADPMCSAVIRRCNAIWKHFDYYGNVLTEPFVFQDARAQSTANEYLDWDVIPNWYQKCVMQLNDETKEIMYNRRIAIGSSIGEVRGLVDFITDFSGDTDETTTNAEPTHVLFFDLQYQPPTEIDDMERGIAGGKAFSWTLAPSYSPEMGIGGTQTISVNSIRNGEMPDTVNHPVSYTFASSDETVATVDENGVVTSLAEGETEITIALEQNPSITAVISISVVAEAEMQFVFTPELPDRMKQMQTFTGTVKVMQGGSEVVSDIQMEAYGATEDAEAIFTDRSITITSYSPSNVPLSLVFKDKDHNLTFTKQIKLEGY